MLLFLLMIQIFPFPRNIFTVSSDFFFLTINILELFTSGMKHNRAVDTVQINN